ncbi:TonB-dependent receptor [Sphingomonas sp. MAH-20]|uniref:TonB-dependent receptor n=1 Tax=Sphingomonas horti TaxID=2682842 RepID=A0A6I4J4F9_9SPHN|nr:MULTISPECIES: TonB-dependent receptor [Sphingomonas]MBA2919194.1 TonB-dependent receptor [Sphingomonas sp. CGMCC 1.13658]MVO79227.1 TonB-dependent receptor [Sphingomonas horti]
MQLALRRHLLASTVLLGASMLGTAAYAQTQAAEAAPDEGTIVVTGSLITNPNLERSAPVNVTTSEEVELRQTNVAEQLLREVPGVVPSIGSAVNNGNGGASFVNLRGLGSQRNIVLIDGVRLVPAELNGRFDLNNIPLALIERTEVLTGGASTTYGADAVSGVVNFITKRNFSGLEVSASEQITERGDGNIFRVDATIGANFDDGRGNAVFSIGYQEADPVYQGARSFSRFNISALNRAVSGSGTAVPSTFSGVNPTGTACTTAATCAPVQGSRQVNGAGNAFNATSAQSVPFNFNPYNVFQTPFQRFNIFGQANYEVTDGVEVYTRGLFSKNTVQTIIAPSGAFGIAVDLPLNNPFLTDAQRNAFCAFDTTANDGVYTPRFTPAECAAAANPALRPGDAAYREATVSLSRRATEVGPRVSTYVTQIFDYRLGVRGGITDSINYDLFGSYGESENLQNIGGYTLNSRFQQGVRAGGTRANPVCFDDSNGCVPVDVFGPEGSITAPMVDFLTADSTVLTRTTLAQARATVSGDFGATLPWASDAVSFAIGGEYRRYTALQKSDTLAESGDLGGAGGASPFINGGFDVYEAFGELIAPLVQDKPFFQSLTFEGGIRYSHYTVNAPGAPKFNTTTWKLGGSWEPISAIKFRGNYAHAVRAPNIAELFSPVNTGLTSLSDDPCASIDDQGNVIRGVPSGTLAAVCTAQGAPNSSLGAIPVPTAGQANATGGGNLNLKPEKSNSWTVGAVIQPDFLPGFSASIDYYNIKVSGAITSPTPDDAITACFGEPSGSHTVRLASGQTAVIPDYTPGANAASSSACTIIRRNPLRGDLSGDPAIAPGLFLATSNLGRLKTDGIDATMNYNTDLGFAKLALSFAGNWTRENRFQAVTGVGLFRQCVGYISPNCGSLQPEFSWTQRTTLSFENVDVSLLWRHLSSFRIEPDAAGTFGNLVGATPSNNSTLPGSPQQGAFGTRNLGFIPSFDYFDLATRIGVGDNLTLTLTVANLFDKKPPLTGQDIGTTSYNSGNTFPSTFDALGRTYRVGARLRF